MKNLHSLTLTPFLILMVASVGVAPASAESCPNEASRQGPSVNLPECRVYEQVTPVDKGDAVDIFGTTLKGDEGIGVEKGNEAFVAEDGDAILVHTDGSFATDATASASAYVFSRNATEWHMNVLAEPVKQPQEAGETPEFMLDPRDLSEVGFNIEVGTQSERFGGDPSAFHDTELLGPAGGPYSPLASLTGFATLTPIRMVGGSEDLSRVVLQSEQHSLAPGAEAQDAGSEALYETTGGECAPTSTACKLVNVNDQGEPLSPCGAVLGQYPRISDGGGTHSAVSSDGSKIFFTAPEPQPQTSGVGCWNHGPDYDQENPPEHEENPPELYVREDGTRTVEISKPEEGVKMAPENPENPELPAVFVGASANGSKVFFMTKMQLTQGATGHDPELYEYNFEPGPQEKKLTLISGGPSGTLEGDVDSVTAVSSDGSAVYFSAFDELASGASKDSPEGDYLSPVNLYRYDTTTGVTTYITTLTRWDYPLHFGNLESWYGRELGSGQSGERSTGTEEEGLADSKEWYTTGDGRFLVFGTVSPLTGFDNKEAPGEYCPNNFTAAPRVEACFELYRYDAEAAERHEPSLLCVSCVGGAPVDGAYFARNYLESAASEPPRPISENGEDVFFESASALVPNATPGRTHVYEWHNGALSLISSPNDPGNALFLGSSADGSNVFFVTHTQLAASDTDQSADIYDARVDGGFAGLTPSQCTGTGCQGVPAAPPIFATPSSVTFEGVGNFPPPPSPAVVKPAKKTVKCGKGKKLSHGKCVRRPRPKKLKKK
jgi:hypothetical protein